MKILAGVFCLLAFLFLPLHADEVNSSLQRLEEIKKELREKKKEITKAKRRESTILSIVDGLDAEISKLSSEEMGLSSRIKEINAEINQTREELSGIDIELGKRKMLFKKRVLSLFRISQTGYLPAIIGVKDLREFMIRNKFLNILIMRDRTLIDRMEYDYNARRNVLKKMESLQGELALQSNELKDKKSVLIFKKNEKNVILVKIKNERLLYQRTIEELNESYKEMEKMISTIKFQPSTTEDGDFIARKKALPLPVDGMVVKGFGREEDPRFHTVIYRKGIVIAAREGEDVRCIYSGVVVFAGRFAGYGNLVIVKHGNNFYSIYAHISTVAKRVGDKVSENEVIGYAGDPLSALEGGLYFELRNGGTPLDPAEWLSIK